MKNKSKLDNLLQDAIKVITNPVGFYRDMPKTGGFADPVIFMLVLTVIMCLVIAVLSLAGAGTIGAIAAGFGAIFFIPIFALIGSFIGAAILFVIWKLMGSDESYETAYRCVAYAAAIYPITTVLGLIPYIGSVAGVAWGTYLMITASIEVHQLSRNTAYTVFGILGALLIMMNLGTEMAAREMASKAQGLEEQFEVIGSPFQQPGEMTPEQAGKSMGDFMKGLGNAARNINENNGNGYTETDPSKPVASESTGPDSTMTPEQAGKALGDFLKGFGEATESLRKQAVPAATRPDSATSSSSSAVDDATTGQGQGQGQ